MHRSETVLISRTGQPALCLTGYGLVATASSRSTSGPRQNRWHEIDLWCADDQIQGPEQRYCLAIRYRTQWDGELGHDHAEILLRRQIGDALRHYDPLEHLVGYPEGGAYAQKQALLQRSVRSGYEHAVSELLAIAKVWEVGDQTRCKCDSRSAAAANPTARKSGTSPTWPTYE